MPDHDVIEFTMRANESCFDEFEFRKTLMKVLKLRDRSLFMGGWMGEKMGGPEILATAKRGVLGKFFVIEGGS